MRDIMIASMAGLVGQLPSILAYFIGIILSLVFRHRTQKTCMLVLVATGLLLVFTVLHPFTVQYLLQTHSDWGWSQKNLGIALAAVGFAYSMVHGTGIALLITAAFIGRLKRTK